MLGPDIGLYISMVLFGTAGAYIVGIAMNGLMGDDGFGSIPNAIILISGGFLGFYLPKYFYFLMGDVTLRAVLVVSGAFLSLALLATFKAVASRFGY
jgi:hypothetical protein